MRLDKPIHMDVEIPYSRWRPLSVAELSVIFANCPFKWGLAGGYAIEQFLGRIVRAHEDIDLIVFRDDQLRLQDWLGDWLLYAADPPGVLRKWTNGEYLPFGIHDIWGYRFGSEAWQLQIMLAEAEGVEWYSRNNRAIRGIRSALIVGYNGIPCIRVEVQLLYKAKSHRPKDDLDFQACLPHLDSEARTWLKEKLILLYPQGHSWLSALSEENI
jgi:hypothetical protein